MEDKELAKKLSFTSNGLIRETYTDKDEVEIKINYESQEWILLSTEKLKNGQRVLIKRYVGWVGEYTITYGIYYNKKFYIKELSDGIAYIKYEKNDPISIEKSVLAHDQVTPIYDDTITLDKLKEEYIQRQILFKCEHDSYSNLQCVLASRCMCDAVKEYLKTRDLVYNDEGTFKP